MVPRRIGAWVLVIGGGILAIWGLAAITVAALGTLQIAFRDESMVGLGFVFGIPCTAAGAAVVAVGLALGRGGKRS